VTADASDTPLLAAWEAAVRADRAPMVIPGHKGSTGLVGEVVAGDVPLYAGLDTLHLERGVLARAEALAARAWGVDWCRFSVAGSTHGNQALALAVGRPGDEVVVSRSLHRSLLLGLVLAGLVPVWVSPDLDAATGLPLGVPAERVATALREHPGARAVFLVEPGYTGAISDVRGAAAVAHGHGIPLVVDGAWGAHLGWAPGLPPSPLALGADAMVTSAHKLLPAYSQAALVLARTARLDADRLDRGFEATHTTSPAGAILASTDAARALLERDGERLLGGTLDLVREARDVLRAVPGLGLPGGAGDRWDPTRLVLSLPGTGADGMAVERDLVAAGLPVEMADHDTVVATVTVADTAETVGRFVSEVRAAVERHRGEPRPPAGGSAWTASAELVVPPREAFFADRVAVPLDEAVGRVAAELVAPYPPGVPALVPGERVAAATVAGLRAALTGGTRVAYAADPTLRTVQVLTADG
jgi:lysine decarboxylase